MAYSSLASVIVVLALVIVLLWRRHQPGPTPEVVVDAASLAVQSAVTAAIDGPRAALTAAAASPLLVRMNEMFRDRLKSAMDRPGPPLSNRQARSEVPIVVVSE